jgi:hypothetical protein
MPDILAVLADDVPAPGSIWMKETGGRAFKARVLAVVPAEPEPMLLLEIGAYDPSRELMLLSDWRQWLQLTGAQAAPQAT